MLAPAPDNDLWRASQEVARARHAPVRVRVGLGVREAMIRYVWQ